MITGRKSVRMSGGHFGIDPRKHFAATLARATPVYLCHSKASHSVGNNFGIPNPYILPRLNSHNGSQNRATTALSTSNSRPNKTNGRELSRLFDRMAAATKEVPLHIAIEAALKELLQADDVYAWFNLRSQCKLSSLSLAKSCFYHQSILAEVYHTRDILVVDDPTKHEKYNGDVDRKIPTLYLPLISGDDNMLGVCQIVRKGSPFTQDDMEDAKAFSQKYAYYDHLFSPNQDFSALAGQLDEPGNYAQVICIISEKLAQYFNCRSLEFYCLESFDYSFTIFDPEKAAFEPLDGPPGSIQQVLQDYVSIISSDVTKLQNYDPDFDGNEPESIMAFPFRIDNGTFAIVLRGKNGDKEFSAIDFNMMTSLIPLIASLIQKTMALEDGWESEEGSQKTKRLQALLEVAEILSGVMDIDELVTTIMERSCTLLHTERCSLFLIDKIKKEMITTFHGGLDKGIRIPLGRGIVGYTATTGNVVNIEDAYSDSRFDKEVDQKTGYQTKTILTVPIYNNRGDIIGVTEMINKKDGGAFDDEDIKMMMAFNVFCGISLDNAKLYRTSLDLTTKLRNFVEMSSSLNKTLTIRDVLDEILGSARAAANATRASLYLFDEDTNTITKYSTLGEKNEHGDIFVQKAIKERKPLAFDRFMIASLEQPEELTNSTGESQVNYSISRVGTVLSCNELKEMSSSNSIEQSAPETLCEFPLMTQDSRVLGVLEVSINSKVMREDLKLLDCFAVFASVSLEKNQLHEIATHGKVEVKMTQYISQDERDKYETPLRLKIEDDKKNMIYTVNFDAPEWDGIGLIKVLFNFFNKYDFLKTYKITNEKLFRFISAVSDTYKKVPYHNWRHAVDVTQFIMYELAVSPSDAMFSKFELFGLTVAAICHDAGHDGFSNTYNEQAETPCGILFKNQSVMETHHCSTAISIISKDETNIFADLDRADYKQMWTNIISLILATDMAKHHDLLNEMKNIIETNKKINNEDPNENLLLMKLYLKCGDISNVSRPFELADKWCDVLCEEFFRQGDLEMTQGMEYTSPLNDRTHLDKPKSQIGFYTYVCLPLFQVLASAVPELQVNVDQVMSNLSVWKAELGH